MPCSKSPDVRLILAVSIGLEALTDFGFGNEEESSLLRKLHESNIVIEYGLT